MIISLEWNAWPTSDQNAVEIWMGEDTLGLAPVGQAVLTFEQAKHFRAAMMEGDPRSDHSVNVIESGWEGVESKYAALGQTS